VNQGDVNWFKLIVPPVVGGGKETKTPDRCRDLDAS
jgi:hypothetical protein